MIHTNRTIEGSAVGRFQNFKSRRARLLTERFATNHNAAVGTSYGTIWALSTESIGASEIGFSTSPIATPSGRAITPTNLGVVLE